MGSGAKPQQPTISVHFEGLGTLSVKTSHKIMFGKIFITQLRNCVMLVTPLTITPRNPSTLLMHSAASYYGTVELELPSGECISLGAKIAAAVESPC